MVRRCLPTNSCHGVDAVRVWCSNTLCGPHGASSTWIPVDVLCVLFGEFVRKDVGWALVLELPLPIRVASAHHSGPCADHVCSFQVAPPANWPQTLPEALCTRPGLHCPRVCEDYRRCVALTGREWSLGRMSCVPAVL